jgi:Trypsin-like peptidase domain
LSGWRVRLRAGAGGPVLGAGMLIGTEQVLTCAHVVEGYAADGPSGRPGLVADLVGWDGRQVPARVLPGYWVPPTADGSGDVALLELAAPHPPEYGARLWRWPTNRGRPVWTGGFPDDYEDGLWIRATLAGPCGPNGEWIQLDPDATGTIVERGFSGAAVEDEGYVIGMVVARRTRGLPLSYMIPVQSILRHLRVLAAYTAGPPAVDSSVHGEPDSKRLPDDAAATVEFAEQVAAWLSDQRTPAVWWVVAGARDSPRSAVIRRAVALTDREWWHRDAAAGGSPASTVPPVGSIDLAIDVTGLGVADVARQIVRRLRPADALQVSPYDWLRHEAPPVSTVVDGLDAAAAPEALVRQVLAALVGRGGRAMLVLRREPEPALRAALDELAALPAPAVTDRLDRLAGQVDALAAAEQAVELLYARLRPRFPEAVERLAPDVLGGAVASRVALTALRSAAAAGDPDLPAEVAAAEGALARRRQRVADLHAALARLDGQHERIRALRRRLDADSARAAAYGEPDERVPAERELVAAFQDAYDAVWCAPFDVPAATELIRRYEAAVRRRAATRP